MCEKQSETIKMGFGSNVHKALQEEMEDQRHKYKMRNHTRGGWTERKGVRATVKLKANMNKAGKSPERQISY